MGTEIMKINRIVSKGGRIYVSVHRGYNSYRAQESEVLTAIYGEAKDWDSVCNKILQEAVAGRIQLIGRQGKIGYIRGILESLDEESKEDIKRADEESRKKIESLDIGAKIATAEALGTPSLRPWTIEMKSGEILAGAYIFKIGEEEELTPYSTADIDGATPKYFLSKGQAEQYIEAIKRKCPQWAVYNFQLRQKQNTRDFTGIAKIANFCKKAGIELQHVKNAKDSEGRLVRYFRFMDKTWYRLEARQDTPTTATYTLYASGKVLYETTNQLKVIDRLKKIYKTEDK